MYVCDTCLYYVYVILCIHVSILNVNIYVCVPVHTFSHTFICMYVRTHRYLCKYTLAHCAHV